MPIPAMLSRFKEVPKTTPEVNMPGLILDLSFCSQVWNPYCSHDDVQLKLNCEGDKTRRVTTPVDLMTKNDLQGRMELGIVLIHILGCSGNQEIDGKSGFGNKNRIQVVNKMDWPKVKNFSFEF
jgi:hypothetical protein